jgi:hypothetical protein
MCLYVMDVERLYIHMYSFSISSMGFRIPVNRVVIKNKIFVKILQDMRKEKRERERIRGKNKGRSSLPRK